MDASGRVEQGKDRTNQTTTNRPAVFFLLAFLITWLYYRNNRSVIACLLFHLPADLALAIIPAEQFTKCIVTGVLILIAAVIVLADRKLFFEETYPGPV